MKLVGLDQVRRKLKNLEAKAGKAAIKKGIQAAVKPMLDAAKAEAPKDTGTLLKALGTKVKSYRGGTTQVGMVGARAGQKREITRTISKRGKQRIKLKKTTAKNSRTTEVRDASRTLHLAESGRKAVKGKNGKKMVMRLAGGTVVAARSARATKGHGFMKKAWAKVRMAAKQTALAAMAAEINQQLRSA